MRHLPQVHEDTRAAPGAQEVPHCPRWRAQVRKASTARAPTPWYLTKPHPLLTLSIRPNAWQNPSPTFTQYPSRYLTKPHLTSVPIPSVSPGFRQDSIQKHCLRIRLDTQMIVAGLIEQCFRVTSLQSHTEACYTHRKFLNVSKTNDGVNKYRLFDLVWLVLNTMLNTVNLGGFAQTVTQVRFLCKSDWNLNLLIDCPHCV